jgi:hypothetical protein
MRRKTTVPDPNKPKMQTRNKTQRLGDLHGGKRPNPGFMEALPVDDQTPAGLAPLPDFRKNMI